MAVNDGTRRTEPPYKLPDTRPPWRQRLERFRALAALAAGPGVDVESTFTEVWPGHRHTHRFGAIDWFSLLRDMAIDIGYALAPRVDHIALTCPSTPAELVELARSAKWTELGAAFPAAWALIGTLADALDRATNPEHTRLTGMKFAAKDRVMHVTLDCVYEGEIIAIVTKRKRSPVEMSRDPIRYVFEDDDGMLLVLSESQLEPVAK